MPRTTAELVGGIIEVDSSIDLEPFILPANELVTEVCATEEAGLSDERLELIERYLAAHFYTLRDPRAVSERAATIEQVNQSKVDLYLCTSHYGQMAIILDTSGGLAELNNDAKTTKGRRTVSLTWLGSCPETTGVPQRNLLVPDI